MAVAMGMKGGRDRMQPEESTVVAENVTLAIQQCLL